MELKKKKKFVEKKNFFFFFKFVEVFHFIKMLNEGNLISENDFFLIQFQIFHKFLFELLGDVEK